MFHPLTELMGLLNVGQCLTVCIRRRVLTSWLRADAQVEAYCLLKDATASRPNNSGSSAGGDGWIQGMFRPSFQPQLESQECC